MDKVDILGVDVAVTDLQLASEQVEEWIKDKHKTYVCFAPASTLVDCQSDDKYSDVINASGMTAADGVPLVWIAKAKGIKKIERTGGTDFLPYFCALSQEPQYRHFFYGGTEETIVLLVDRLKERFPQINIVGYHSPSRQEVGQIEEQKVIDQINDANPDVLWVGLGSPKQDYWMSNHREKLNVPVLLGVGAAFDFVAGIKPRAPKWMCQNGLEWLFRLCSEPKRLWKRYFIGNSKFIYYLIRKELFKRKKK